MYLIHIKSNGLARLIEEPVDTYSSGNDGVEPLALVYPIHTPDGDV